MKIDDLLSLAGDHPLNSFPWGGRIVDAVNFVADQNHRVNVELTGREARTIVRSLPSPSLMRLFAMDFDPETGEVKEQAEHHHEPEPFKAPTPHFEPGPGYGGGMMPAPAGMPPGYGPVGYPPPRMPAVEPNHAKSTMALIMGGVITFIALMLAVVISFTAVKTGQMPDTRALTSFGQVMSDVIRVYMDDGKGPPPTSPNTPNYDPGYNAYPTPVYNNDAYPSAPLGGDVPYNPQPRE